MTVSRRDYPSSTLYQDGRQSVAQQLKDATGVLHRQLDSHTLVRALARSELNETDHEQLLAAFYHAYQQLETQLIHFADQYTIDAPYTPRLPCLAHALSLPHTYSEQSITELTPSAYWGARYVVDGSCHGAKVLLPRLQIRLGDDHPGLEYWRLLARQNEHWPAVVKRLNSFEADDRLVNACVQAAASTFQCFLSALPSAVTGPHQKQTVE